MNNVLRIDTPQTLKIFVYVHYLDIYNVSTVISILNNILDTVDEIYLGLEDLNSITEKCYKRCIENFEMEAFDQELVDNFININKHNYYKDLHKLVTETIEHFQTYCLDYGLYNKPKRVKSFDEYTILISEMTIEEIEAIRIENEIAISKIR